MSFSRRAFLGGATALAVWPGDLWAAPKKGGKMPSVVRIWERSDGSATDAVMVRRLFLDLAGRLPSVVEAKEYVLSKQPDKRQVLVERLLGSKEFVDYWTMRFCDILRVKSEFPINLWPNAVYVYHARIRAFVEGNEPWDRFGRALLTSQGSNFRDAEVNFFRATDKRDPDGWAEAVAQTFLGIPPSTLSEKTRTMLSAYFSNVKMKKTREWKEEIVYVDGGDRRGELCDRLFVRNRQAVADAFHSCVRKWIFGPAAQTKAVKDGGISGLKDVVKGIVLSDEYSRGSVTGGFPARRLDAEVLDDIFCSLNGTMRNFQSPAPEPFTFLPPERPTVCIEDGSISNGFLTLFGRPARDTGLMEERGLDITAKQRLYLFNSRSLHRKLTSFAIPRWRLQDGTVNPYYRRTMRSRLGEIYWTLLSREPSKHEDDVIFRMWRRRSNGGKNRKANFNELLRDVAWSIVNSKEFLFRI